MENMSLLKLLIVLKYIWFECRTGNRTGCDLHHREGKYSESDGVFWRSPGFIGANLVMRLAWEMGRQIKRLTEIYTYVHT